MELTLESGSWWSYVVVFLAAGVPILEILVVIPAGILAGMSPVPTAAAALAGNLVTVVLVAVAGDKLLAWWRRRRPAKERPTSRRTQRARDVARRWGVPGLAMLAPLTTGTHVATVAALATGARRHRVLWWMAAGLAVWATAVTVTTVVGVDAIA